MRIMPASENGNRPDPLTATESLHAAGENMLLARLPTAVLSLLQRHVHRRSLAEGAMLWDAGEIPDQIFFPSSGMISIRVATKNGHAVEVATVGREAAIGFNVTPTVAITQAVVRISGQFVCIRQDAYAAAAQEFDELNRLMSHCNNWLLLQAQQIAACNTAHAADARFCRWLLRTNEVIADDTVPATQETIAEALGVRRTTATLIAQGLQLAHVIRYSRGKIVIRDRARLEAAACNCHAVLGRGNWPSELMCTAPMFRSSRPTQF